VLIVIGGGSASVCWPCVADALLPRTCGARPFVLSASHTFGLVTMTLTWLLHARTGCQAMHALTYVAVEGWLGLAVAEVSLQAAELGLSHSASTVVATYLLVIDIAAGFGPFCVGLISDSLAKGGASPGESLRMALTYVTSVCMAMSVLLFVACGRSLHLGDRQRRLMGAAATDVCEAFEDT